MTKLSAIVATGFDRVMGNGADIPWHLPADFKHFKETTVGKTIIMGRKTFQSIGKPLPNRTTVVLSTTLKEAPEGVILVSDITELKLYLSINECILSDVFVCGGAEIYKTLLPYIGTFYITHVQARVKGDIIFPKIPLQDWDSELLKSTEIDDKNNYRCIYMKYTRRD